MITYRHVKSFADRMLALMLIMLLAPFLLMITLIVFMQLGPPLLYCQLRPGYRARPFYLLKFRTMTCQQDDSGSDLPDADRLTPLGRLLRSTSFDELPALINVLKGEISFIGPRPLLMQYLPLYSAEHSRRHDVMPGFSGWAQINGRNTLDWEEKFRLDVWYVDHQTFFLDFYIFISTIWIVISRQGISAAGQATIKPFTGYLSTSTDE
jgi:sugar transferase EpsL